MLIDNVAFYLCPEFSKGDRDIYMLSVVTSSSLKCIWTEEGLSLSGFSYTRDIRLISGCVCAKEHMNEADIQKTNQRVAYCKTHVKNSDGSSCYYICVKQVLSNMCILAAHGAGDLPRLAKIACEIQHTSWAHIHCSLRNLFMHLACCKPEPANTDPHAMHDRSRNTIAISTKLITVCK